MAQHYVCRGGKYWSLEQSYREGGKVKKRRLAYYGKKGPPSPRADAEERALAVAERAGEKSDQWQREHLGETALERQEREKAKSNLPAGMHPGPTPPVEVERAPSPALPDAVAPDAGKSATEAPSEPDGLDGSGEEVG